MSSLRNEPTPGNPLLQAWQWSWKYLLDNWAELTKFVTVGGANYLVDLAVFNLCLLVIIPNWPLTSKIIAVTLATTFSWIANRSWTFRSRNRHKIVKEIVLFIAVNILGALPPIICLWFSHYLLNLQSALADNISANVIGLILGTALRYVLYRMIVFPAQPN